MANMGPAAGRAGPIKDDSMGQQAKDPKTNLATFIYDYFLKRGKVDLANAMLSNADLGVRTRPRSNKKSPGGTANGVDDPMDLEPKDELMKKIEALPEADIHEQIPRDSFLEDWWSVFWDIWSAGKGRKSSAAASQYMQQTAANRQMVQHRMAQQQMMNGMRPGMNPNIGRMNTNDMRSLAMQNRQGMNQITRNMPNLTPQQQAQLQGDMANQQQPQSPMSNENAPSPKRPRIGEPPFGTPQMNTGAQNRPVSMPMPSGPVQQPGMMAGNMDMANGPFNMGGNPQRFGGMNHQIPGVKQDFNNNADMSFEEMNLFAGDPIRMGNGSQQGGALADYQMQLMLLEQQNKKRLLMARQEQEVTSQGGAPGAAPALMGPGGAGAGPPFQQGLSPRRGGQSPSPNDPTKRANSSMGQASPRPDQMPMTRGSPAPGAFDPSQMGGGMAGQFSFAPNQMGGPNGMRPGGPGFPGQGGAPTMEQIRARGNLPANWQVHPGVQPGNMGPGPQPGQNNQQPQQNPMPPPSAPNAGPNAGRTNPSSPAPGANPPTPQQNKNANAKGGKKDAPKDNKKAKSGKKAPNNTGATPSSEAEANRPPTPTPSTPITPSAPNNPFKPGQAGAHVQGPNNGQPPQPQLPNMPGPQDPNAMNPNNPFGQLHESNEVDFPSFDLGGPDPNDVLEGFDFDSFLNTDNHDGAFGFDAGFNMNGDGVEMGARDA